VRNNRPISRPFLIALVLLIVCLAAPVWADFKAGVDAYLREDYPKALREWRPLAVQGDADAQQNLGWLYENGLGMPQDSLQARQWYEKAAAQGHANAQQNLGTLYLNGDGVPKDYEQALRWFRLAANKGNAFALTKLCLMYARGKGVPQDFVQAHMWCDLATANGDKMGASLRENLADKMTPAQIAEAQQLAREWKPKSK
jgi:TPR repeat protein